MYKFEITGGTPLKGQVKIGGAKNSVLELIAASMLTDEEVILHNVPALADIATFEELLRYLGVGYAYDSTTHTLKIHAKEIKTSKAPYEIVKKMRASIYVLSPILARKNEAIVSLPGGCTIGSRPVDRYIDAWKKMGANIEIKNGYIETFAPQGLKGCKIDCVKKSHGATATTIMSAVLAKGQTIIEDAAIEPEVTDLCKMLNKMGAKISGLDTPTLVIDGVDKLHGCEYVVMPDRLEAATYAFAACITGGCVEIMDAEPSHLNDVLEKLQAMGVKIELRESGFLVDATGVKLKAVDVHVDRDPGFPTDLQSPFMAMMTVAQGSSVVEETVFENRFMYVPEMRRMGANIEHNDNNMAKFIGVKELNGTDVMAADLRSGAALVLCGLVAQGKTTVHRIYHIDRGYEHFEEKLSSLGAKISRLKDDII